MDLLTDHLADARAAYQRRDWSASVAAFVRADGVGPMTVDDLDAFATAAWRLGAASEAVRLSERVYDRLVRTDPAAASTKALDLALQWLSRGDANVGRSWLDQARRLLAGEPIGVANGRLAYLDAVVAIRRGEAAERAAAVVVARTTCASLDEPALGSLAALVVALDALHRRRVDEAYGLVARALPRVESGEVGQDWAGHAYGLLLHAGRTLADAARMQEWTESMTRWCDAHNATVHHRVVHVYRATSEHELLTESSALEGVDALGAGVGFHRLGAMRRGRGDAEGARAAFARAQRLGVSAPTDTP